MTRTPPFLLAAGLALTLSAAPSKAEDAKQVAVKVTTAGAAMFDARDAKGLALSYAEDGRLEVISKEKDSGELKTETKVGRNEIEAYYRELFKSDDVIHARNTVESARLLDAELLTITGIFEPNTESGTPLKLPFIQVRVRRGGEWRIVSLQLFIVPQE